MTQRAFALEPDAQLRYNLNADFHTLAVDGVFVREPDGSLSFTFECTYCVVVLTRLCPAM